MVFDFEGPCWEGAAVGSEGWNCVGDGASRAGTQALEPGKPGFKSQPCFPPAVDLGHVS